jgi:4-diphosphocytidyl-2-C-methyl-D-erythritol kinase
MKTLRLEAPAKVNYRLDVLRKRPDGYHELRMVMQRIDLSDLIDITITDIPGIRVTCGRAGVPDGPGNIAWAPPISCSSSPVRRRGSISGSPSRSRWPQEWRSSDGCGPDGGERAPGDGLSDHRLMEIGVKLGADVPFFIFKKTALAEGIGEILSPIERVPTAWLAIVNPNIHVSTAWVYQNLQLTSREDEHIIPRFYERFADLAPSFPMTLNRSPSSAFRSSPKSGAVDCCGPAALMSRSGPTVFGVRG